MSIGFLSNFMRVAHNITRADRSVALDLDMSIHDRMNVDDVILASDDFRQMLQNAVTDAMAQNTVVLTNNMVSVKPYDTNTHLPGVRLGVAIPLDGIGAIYLDQHLRVGAISNEVTDRLLLLGRYVIENNQTDLSQDDLATLYDEISFPL